MNKITYNIEATPENFLAASELAARSLEQCGKIMPQRKDVDWIEPFMLLVGGMMGRKYAAGSADYEKIDEAMEKLEGAMLGVECSATNSMDEGDREAITALGFDCQPGPKLDVGMGMWWKNQFEAEKEFNPTWLVIHLEWFRQFATEIAAPISAALISRCPEIKDEAMRRRQEANINELKETWEAADRIGTPKDRKEFWESWVLSKPRMMGDTLTKERFMDYQETWNKDRPASRRVVYTSYASAKRDANRLGWCDKTKSWKKVKTKS